MIDLQYGSKDWGIAAGLREIIANAIDTKSKYSYLYEDGVATISDEGSGLPRKAFIMGSSSKSSDATSIGQFGEGLKMCMVTALRNHKKMSIKTVGYGVELEAVHSNEYDTDIMRVLFTDLATEHGTVIKMECSEEEYNNALEMFLQFRKGYKKLERNLYLPGGYLSILGLTTEERPNLLFSYDLNDKSLTNRDRNTVKTKQLKTEMEKILSGIRHKETTKLYLKGLKDVPESEEYKVTFVPKYPDVWKDAVQDIYGEDVVFSSNSEADIKAVYKGIKVIPCPTKAVRKLFESLGYKSAAMKTRRVSAKNVQLTDENKITYPIARNYVDKWTILDAGREIVANALDASEHAAVTHDKGVCCIEDTGTGIARKHFVIGNSQKETDQIGLFGEGFKLASLVMAREKREMVIETAGYTYKPILEYSEEFGTEIFCIYYEKNKRKTGTSVHFKATAKEVAKIKEKFICFQESIQPVYSTPELDIYPLKGNEKASVYVNGLQTVQIDAIYSYNVKVRDLVDSRDRNHIDEAKFNNLLTGFYDHVSDTAIIDRIMTAWQESTYYREYSLVLEPEMPMFWYGEVEKLFPASCIESMVSWKSNFIAASAGYQLLRNVPPYILKVLSNSVKTADEIAEKYQDKGIMLNNRIVYPITDDYLPDWKVEDACTELISNAIDTGFFVRAEYVDGKIVIEDTGKGLKKENFLIGKSSSNGVGQAIGAFGEGLKLACLVIGRSTSKGVLIETRDFTAKAVVQEDTNFHANLLYVEINESKRSNTGTKISFTGTKEDLMRSKKRFLEMKEGKMISDGIHLFQSGENGIYVNGVMVKPINGLYSYNLTGRYAKQNLTRDRKAFKSPDTADRAVMSLLEDVTDKEIIKNYLLHTSMDMYESNLFIVDSRWFSTTTKRRWKKVALEVFPDSAIAGSEETELILNAKDKGITILDPPYCIKCLLREIGFPTVKEALSALKKDKDIEVIPPSRLPAAQKKKYDLTVLVAKAEYGDVAAKKMKVAKNLPDTEDGKVVQGLYDRLQDTVYLSYSLFSPEYPIEKLLGVLSHEFEHRKSGAEDRTRDFENALTDKIGELLAQKYS